MVDVESRARFASIMVLHLRVIDRARFRPSDVITTGPQWTTPDPVVVQGSMSHNIRTKRLTTNRRRNISFKERWAPITRSKPPKRARICPSRLSSPTVTTAYPAASSSFTLGSAEWSIDSPKAKCSQVTSCAFSGRDISPGPSARRYIPALRIRL